MIPVLLGVSVASTGAAFVCFMALLGADTGRAVVGLGLATCAFVGIAAGCTSAMEAAEPHDATPCACECAP